MYIPGLFDHRKSLSVNSSSKRCICAMALTALKSEGMKLLKSNFASIMTSGRYDWNSIISRRMLSCIRFFSSAVSTPVSTESGLEELIAELYRVARSWTPGKRRHSSSRTFLRQPFQLRIAVLRSCEIFSA